MKHRRLPRRVQPVLKGLKAVPAKPQRGRPRSEDDFPRHRPRPALDPRHPVLVTMRLDRTLPSYRRRPTYREIERGITGARERLGVRLVHFSVQHTHIHLIVEAESVKALGRGLKGLGVRVARGVNRVLGRKGRVVAQRYHALVLERPLQVRTAIRYVLQNIRKHMPTWVGLDPMSSALQFDGWRERQ